MMSNENTPTETKLFENNSGHGSGIDLPEEIKGWSWGAFLLTWIWGMGNNVYRSFLCFIPFIGFVMWILLGLKGREWAWQYKRWKSIDEFKKVQRHWTIAGIIIGILGLFLNLLIPCLFLFAIFA